jgi:NADH-quinone oxidoreductase subunit M
MDELSGLWSSLPRVGGVAMFLAVASLGLPGLANFVGEFLVLTGAFAVSPVLAAIAAIGFVLSSIYSLWLIYRVFQGPKRRTEEAADLGRREMAIFGAIIVVIVWLGLYPQPVLRTSRPAVDSLVSSAPYVRRSEGVPPLFLRVEGVSPSNRGQDARDTQGQDALATEGQTREAKYDGR